MQRAHLRSTATALSALLIATAACERGPTEPATDHAQLVTAFVNLAVGAGSSTDGAPVSIPCPAGGQFIVEGTTTVENEGAGSLIRWDNTIRLEGCRMNGDGAVATADGQMAIAGEARFGEPNGQQAPLLYQLSTQVGSMTTIVAGTTRTCSYDLQHAFDASDGSYRISGIACDRTIDVRLPATL